MFWNGKAVKGGGMVTKGRFGNTVRVFACLGVLVLVSLGVAPRTQAVDVSFDPAVHFDAGNGTRSVSIGMHS